MSADPAGKTEYKYSLRGLERTHFKNTQCMVRLTTNHFFKPWTFVESTNNFIRSGPFRIDSQQDGSAVIIFSIGLNPLQILGYANMPGFRSPKIMELVVNNILEDSKLAYTK